MTITLPQLPYTEEALEPYYSARTISFHYGKHHKAYVDNINKLVAGTEFETKSLEEIIAASTSDPARVGWFNNSAQVWNHSFFWNCMKAGGSDGPQGKLAERIDGAFGSYDKFAEQFKTAAVGRFGSGWGWLVVEAGVLKIVTTANADTPIAHGQTPLLTIDVWEHAYYLDYQNRRADFIQAFLDHLVNWKFVAANLANA